MPSLTSRRAHRYPFVALATIALMTACGSTSPKSAAPQASDYCAVLPDSVGLYVGNPITQMGFQVGTVRAIHAETNDVRVDFSVTNGRHLPADVRAIIRSTSILADRSLELVGNYDGGPQLAAGGCVPLNRSSTPKSLSEVIGSATTFVNAINPAGSANVGDVVSEVDAAMRGNGPKVNSLLTTSSAVLDSPEQAIGDIGSIITNLGQLTSTLVDIRGPLKEILMDAQMTTPDVALATQGGEGTLNGVISFLTLVSDLETNLGGETQQTLDTVAVALRKISPHADFLARLMNPVPGWINAVANHVNKGQFNMRLRPPLYRIRTPDGLAACGAMNASMPGSCADVAGQPYAVDVALLQYVLTQANR